MRTSIYDMRDDEIEASRKIRRARIAEAAAAVVFLPVAALLFLILAFA